MKYFPIEKYKYFPSQLPINGWKSLGNIPKLLDFSYIYLLKINNKIYVGSSNSKDRLYQHRRNLIKNKHSNYLLQNAVNKYGIDSIYFIILICIPDYLSNKRLQIENSYIKLFNTYKKGFNLCEFADAPNLGKKFSKEWIRKMAQGHIGLKRTLETRQLMSQRQKEWIKLHPGFNQGQNNFWFGKTHSKETCNKLSTHQNKNKKQVQQIDISTGNIIKIWDSIRDAARGIKNNKECHTLISRACRSFINKRGFITHSAYGYYWKFYE